MKEEGHSNFLEHFEPHAYFHLDYKGIDFSITQYVFWMLVSALIVFLFFFIASRRPRLVPSRLQNVAEALIDFVRNSIVLEIMGPHGLSWTPFIATLFFFILTTNLIGLIPKTGGATSRLSTTITWALIVFFAYNFIGVKKNGIFGYIKSFAPSGVPAWVLIFMVPIEIISHIARPVSLGVRLFANMLAGHMVLAVFTMLAFTAAWWIKWLPFGGIVLMNLFEIFVGAIQAYVFAALAAIYIGSAIHPEH